MSPGSLLSNPFVRRVSLAVDFFLLVRYLEEHFLLCSGCSCQSLSLTVNTLWQTHYHRAWQFMPQILTRELLLNQEFIMKITRQI